MVIVIIALLSMTSDEDDHRGRSGRVTETRKQPSGTEMTTAPACKFLAPLLTGAPNLVYKLKYSQYLIFLLKGANVGLLIIRSPPT